MIFSREFLNHLKSRLTLVQYVSKHIKLQKVGDLLTGLCPFHTEKTPSFIIYDNQGTYHCFGCGAHGDIITFLQEKDKLTFQEAVEFLGDQVGFKSSKIFMRGTEELEILYNICEETASWYHKNLLSQVNQDARNYLSQRGLKSDTVDQFRIGYSPPKENLFNYLKYKGFENYHLVKSGVIVHRGNNCFYDQFLGRIIFPVTNLEGKVVAFGGRSIGDKIPKYKNTPGTQIFHKSKMLYAYPFAKERLEGSPIVVVEGYIDAISLHQAGITGAVAALGSSLTADQIILLWKTHSYPVLCFDGDRAGQEAVKRIIFRLLPILRSGKSLNFVSMPYGEDPDSLLNSKGKLFLEELISNSTPLIEILWKKFVRKEKIRIPEERAEILKKLSLIISNIKDPDVRDQYHDEIQYRIRLVTSRLRRLDNLPLSRQNHNQVLIKLDVPSTQSMILLAIVLLFPEVLKEVSEEFHQLTFEEKYLTLLQREVLFFTSSKENQRRSDVRDFLYHQGLEEFYHKVICREILIHAPFLMEDTQSFSSVLREWKITYSNFKNHEINVNDRIIMKSYLSQNLTDERWKRVKQVYSELNRKDVDGLL